MTKNRLEAFSDGVFSISITLLVLSIRVPGKEVETNRQLIRALKDSWPNVVTFVFSFLVVGVFWVAHHRIFAYIKKVNHFILWANIFYLMMIALIPFPVAILAQHPFFPSAIILYCFVLFLCGSHHFIFLLYINRNRAYMEGTVTSAEFRKVLGVAAVGPVCYLAGGVFSLVSPAISFGFILAALLFYIVVVYYLVRGKVTIIR